MASQSVLVVEDQGLIRLELEEVFRQNGFAVALACDAAQAIEALESAIEAFRALATDINLGGEALNGWELARRARRKSGDTRGLFH